MHAPSSPAKINTKSLGFRVSRRRQHCMENADQHNEIELNFVERGSMVLRHGPNTVTVVPGSTALYWAAIPHQVIAVGPRTEITLLALPLAWFLSWNLPPVISNRLLHGETLIIPEKPRAHLFPPPLTRWAEDFATHSAERLKVIELELEAYFLRLATELPTQKAILAAPLPAVPPEKYECAHVQQMVRFMTEHSAEPITVAQIAGEAGLNPEYAMRLFRKRWGITLWDFLLKQRICQAQRLLVLSNAKVVDIAFQCGFGSVSRFYSAFSKQCSCSPLAFRKNCV